MKPNAGATSKEIAGFPRMKIVQR
jgi:2-polyprenyl-3-methyl-5-hydroxy-6-metoxy-1,4-benzoquinol methylase